MNLFLDFLLYTFGGLLGFFVFALILFIPELIEKFIEWIKEEK